MNNAIKTILLVEDEPDLVSLYTHILERKLKETKYKLITAGSVEVAIDELKKTKPDVIFLDLIIPRKSQSVGDFDERGGFMVLKGCRKIYKEMPKVIVFTNLDSEEDRKEANELGADEYVVKVNLMPQELINLLLQYL